MSRPKALVPNEHLHVTLKPEVKQRLDLLLYSEVENRIPKGAHKEFVEARITEWFEMRHVSLEPFGFPQGYYVTGPQAMMDALILKLKGESK